MYCPKCGKENLPGSFFCANCGTKLPAEKIDQKIIKEERILKQYADTRQYPGKKPKYKDLTYFGEQQMGTFILTDKCILFLRKTTMSRLLGKGALDLAGVASFLAGLPQGLVLTEYIGGKLKSARINPDEVEKIIADDPESLAIPLKEIIQAETKRAYMVTAYLVVEYVTPQGTTACSFVFGTAAKGQKKLAHAILAAKQKAV
jgi:hypothetical protein